MSAANPVLIAPNFFPSQNILSIKELGQGNINDTFLVRTTENNYVLQRLNEQVFPRPEAVIVNMDKITRHLERKSALLGKQYRAVRIIPTRDNNLFYHDSCDQYWRCMDYIADSVTSSSIKTPEQGRLVGRTLGRFHLLMDDYDPDSLQVSLPGFHVLPRYLEAFDRVLQDNSSVDTPEVRYCLRCIDDLRASADFLEQCKKQGRLPIGVIHGDPKMDNVLFDELSGRPLCLIDLDTVGPGLLHYDLGDCLRSCCNSAASETDSQSPIHFKMELFTQVVGGYLDEAESLLLSEQKLLIYEAVLLVTFELALRFFTDHLAGDHYFKVSRRGENLARSCNQFRLMESILQQKDTLRRILAKS